MTELKLPVGTFSAYLFDCDGTIADSMPLHRESWNRALHPWGCNFPIDLFYGWAGMPLGTTVEKLNEKFGLKMPLEQVVRSKEQVYFDLLDQVQPISAVVEHIHLQYGKIPLAVVSGSPRASVIRTLTALKLLDRFEVIVGGEDAPRGKPHPDPFLQAARSLGVEPQNCLVFEDGELGIQAARAAGMSWVKVPTLDYPFT